MPTGQHSTWVLDTLRDASDEAPQARVRVIGADNRTGGSVRVQLPITGAAIAKAAAVADSAGAGSAIRVELLDEKGAYVRGTQRRIEALEPVDPVGQLASTMAVDLGADAAPGGAVAGRAGVRAEHVPILTVERMSRSLADALVRLDASAARREDRLVSMVESSLHAVKGVALGRIGANETVWRELVEAREQAAILAGEAAARDDAAPSGLSADTVRELGSVVAGFRQIGTIGDDAQSGKLLGGLVRQLAAGKGHAALATAVRALSASERTALAGHLLPLLAPG